MNAFSKVHPIVTTLYFLSVLLFSMFVMHPVTEVLILMGAVLYCACLSNRREQLRDLRFYLPMLLLMALANPLFSHNGKTPLFFMNGNAVTAEAIAYGAAMGVLVAGVMLWCKAYSNIMTSDKFVYLFGRLFPKLSLVLSTALRYVPMIRRQAKKVQRAQRAMGLYASDSYADRVRAYLRVISVLVSWSLENAVETSRSMAARGYGLKGRTNYSNFRFLQRDGWLLCLIAVLDCGLLAGLLTGQLAFSYYPAITAAPLTALGAVSYTCCGILALLPASIELEEAIHWNYSRSKI